MNKKENCQNSSEREQHIEVKRTVNQKSTSQEKANQKSMSQKKANQSGEKSVYDENRDALQERVEEKQWKKKQCNGLQHSDDEEKRKSSIPINESSAGITALTTLIFSSIRTVRHRRSSASTRPGWERECPIGRRFLI